MWRNPKRTSCSAGLEYETRPLVPASWCSHTKEDAVAVDIHATRYVKKDLTARSGGKSAAKF